MSEINPVAWHYTNNGGASVWHTGPSSRLDADMEAAKAYPHVHKVVPLYTADALSAARDAALEEAAKVCAALWDDHGSLARAYQCADEIRALKEKR